MGHRSLVAADAGAGAVGLVGEAQLWISTVEGEISQRRWRGDCGGIPVEESRSQGKQGMTAWSLAKADGVEPP